MKKHIISSILFIIGMLLILSESESLLLSVALKTFGFCLLFISPQVDKTMNRIKN